MIRNKDLKKRIIDISFEKKLSHLGSCLSSVDIIDHIYRNFKEGDKFVLSQGHAGLALYVVLEKYYGIDAIKMIDDCGIHPDRSLNTQGYIDCSTGSLGWGLSIAVGMALAARNSNVYCLISDGECVEGIIWESLRIARENSLSNLKIYANFNGYTGYGVSDLENLHSMIKACDFPVEIGNTSKAVDYAPMLQELEGHYHVLTVEEYENLVEVFNEN